MKTYRIENKNGAGPFRPSGGMLMLHAFDAYNKNKVVHPTVDEDNIGNFAYWGSPYICGCDSMESLKHWFNVETVRNHQGLDTPAYLMDEYVKSDMGILKEHDYVISVYETDDDDTHYGKSLTQVMFNHMDANLLETLPISVLFS